ncbi:MULTISPECIES: sulfatase family protein [Pacificibacter]|uniref:sulfatase family protein n=1 Tax=Pacificibacter TaxID=1042323 RepID=UPI001C091A3A|nr:MULTISPECIES: sulfatase-like hydrolase/transferase [Pacificibacter]MBU2937752.1 sulfatase-like hydrolase/transferase [Pacificibacter marinus]MDO6616247.1 sulfatase-like hydrolase/transferase [Pacificibacter sp. 1_MG-2023]
MSDQTKPNFLWICTDQQRFDTIRGLGNTHINTPNLDRLMDEGVSFDRTYCQSPVCTPSRASFLTGRYPRTTRTTRNGNDKFPDDEILVPHILSENGYTCGLIGKLHLSAADGRTEVLPKHHGYDMVKWCHGPRDGWGDDNAYQKWLRSQGVSWETDYHGKNGGIDPQFHQTTWCANEAIGFMDAHEDTPWMLSINIFDPHHPFDPPAEYKAKYPAEDMPLPKWREGELDNKPLIQRDDYENGGQSGLGPSCKTMTDRDIQNYVSDYYAMVDLIDVQVGRLIDHLDKTGQRDNTIIIFHSDHGEMLGDHGLILKGGHFYEELVHVPLIMSCPARLSQKIRSKALVELVDLAPTILDFAGIDVPLAMQGRSLSHILQGKAEPDAHKDAVYCEYYNALPAAHKGVFATMYFDGRYKLTVFHGQDIGELYDHETDPDEFDNKWDDPAYQALKSELVLANFAQTVATVDPVHIVGNF